jgi:uncharacterized Zn finger protein (UPF0148 family)
MIMSGGSQVIDCEKIECKGYLVYKDGNLCCSVCGVLHQGPVRLGGRLL